MPTGVCGKQSHLRLFDPVLTPSALAVHLLGQLLGFKLIDLAMCEALRDTVMSRGLRWPDAELAALPDGTSILRCHHLFGRHKLANEILETGNQLMQRDGLMIMAARMRAGISLGT